MSVLILNPEGRDLAHWSIPESNGSEALEVSFDNRDSWHPLAYDGDEWTILVQGPLATGFPGVVTLEVGLHAALIRAIGTTQVLIRDAGAVQVQPECSPWVVDWSGCTGDPPEDPDERERVESLAISTLRSLTLGRVGGCPITVRPCARQCWERTSHGGNFGSPFFPHVGRRGMWVNSCGCGRSCHCGSVMDEIVLEAPVGRIDEVWVDGAVLSPDSYRVDNGNVLVRHDGGLWPSCQDMAQGDHGPDAFSVTYLNAMPVDAVGAYAAGVLAQEYAKACSGSDCALPAGVTNIVRQGVTYEVQADLFAQGLTGVAAVDAYTARFNPNRLRTKPTVWSPDLNRPRMTSLASRR